MDVPMNEITWLILINQAAEAFKPFVTWVFSIVDMSGRSVSKNNINAALPPDCRPKPTDNRAHLPLCVLIRAAIVPVRSLQTKNIYSSNLYQPAVQVIAAFRRLIFITNIMVALHIVKGGFKKMKQTGKVFRGKITTGNNEVNVRKKAGIDPLI